MNISGRSDRQLKEKFVGTIQLSCEKNIYAYTAGRTDGSCTFNLSAPNMYLCNLFVDNAIKDWKKVFLVSDLFYELYKKSKKAGENANEKLNEYFSTSSYKDLVGRMRDPMRLLFSKEPDDLELEIAILLHREIPVQESERLQEMRTELQEFIHV